MLDVFPGAEQRSRLNKTVVTAICEYALHSEFIIPTNVSRRWIPAFFFFFFKMAVAGAIPDHTNHKVVGLKWISIVVFFFCRNEAAEIMTTNPGQNFWIDDIDVLVVHPRK